MNKQDINLPKTSFSMKANLPNKEPEILKIWEKLDLYKKTKRSLERVKKSLFYMMVHHMQTATYSYGYGT